MTADPSRIVRVTRHFDAPLERVFDAWLDPEMAGKFLFATPTGQMIRVEIDARVGGSFAFTDRRDGEDVEHVGTYLEIDRPRRLAFRFAVPKYSDQFTRVVVEVAPSPGGCVLTLTHEGVLPEYLDRTRQGWGAILSTLAWNVDPNAAFGVVVEPGTIWFERLLPGPIERVWEYLTDSQRRGKWFAAGELEPRVGGSIELQFDHASLASDGETPPEKFKDLAGKPGPSYRERVTRFEPPRVLSWTWDGGIDGASEVTFELTPSGEQVRLVLTHRRLAERHMADVAGGWHMHLAVLVEHLNGRPTTAFWSRLLAVESEYERRLAAK